MSCETFQESNFDRILSFPISFPLFITFGDDSKQIQELKSTRLRIYKRIL